MEKLYAHSSERGEFELLTDHLSAVAKLAKQFAEPFGHGDTAERSGIYHDYGKAHVNFQKRVRGSTIRCDHSTTGAKLVHIEGDIVSAFCIAGHHAGLPDATSTETSSEGASFMNRMNQADVDLDFDLSFYEIPPTYDWVSFSKRRSYDLPFLIRMIFSCLVDADFISTETFIQNRKANRGNYDDLHHLSELLSRYTSNWENPSNDLNRIRNSIRSECIQKAEDNPGLFSLTVPTGGGKTISSMSFALKHAIKHGFKRIIYVIPYTSIIDQTVDEFRKIFGEDNVLAHHSNVDFNLLEVKSINDSDIDADMNLAMRHQLATENWDAPIIVTTSVQFFESFHASRTSRCRKLHNVSESVVIFDEAQLFPRPFLRPCVEVLAALVSHYKVTAVLCTATQPSLNEFFSNIEPTLKINEIISDPRELYNKLKRVRYEFTEDISTDDLADELSTFDQVLCIVNTRAAARDLYFKLASCEGNFHLSTWMTAKDRRKVLHEIRQRLRVGQVCRVISTSLIEAGVDVDFPVVYKEINRLDSILQAGGRCNREKRNSVDSSRVNVFQFNDRKLPKSVQSEVDRTRKVASGREIDDLDSIKAYFDQSYYEMGTGLLDSNKIIDSMESLQFRKVQNDFVMIKDSGWTVYIPDIENEEQINKLRSGYIDRETMRDLAQYSVEVYQHNFQQLVSEHAIEHVDAVSRGGILIRSEAYDSSIGLKFSEIELSNQIM